ncbi:MAG TPA: YfhO family protein, partial [Chthonomonadales bacterium]|nr:YfhO family protein [Chthonomonadales bacterium]
AVTHRLFDMLNVRYITTMPDRTPDTDRFTRVADAELSIWENPRALGRAWMVGRYERIRGLDDAFARLHAPDFDPRQTALLESEPPPLDPIAARGTATMTAFTPHRITVEVNTPGPGLLVLPEIAYPGWRARVDGNVAPVLTANYILRAVPVPKGQHRVVLDYEPASYRVGLYFSTLALAVMVASLTYRGQRRKPQ